MDLEECRFEISAVQLPCKVSIFFLNLCGAKQVVYIVPTPPPTLPPKSNFVLWQEVRMTKVNQDNEVVGSNYELKVVTPLQRNYIFLWSVTEIIQIHISTLDLDLFNMQQKCVDWSRLLFSIAVFLL